jgi:hypothetical protein
VEQFRLRAGVRCARNQNDIALTWQYEQTSARMPGAPLVQPIGTASRTMLAHDAINQKKRILVDTLSFKDSAEEIALVCN